MLSTKEIIADNIKIQSFVLMTFEIKLQDILTRKKKNVSLKVGAEVFPSNRPFEIGSIPRLSSSVSLLTGGNILPRHRD